MLSKEIKQRACKLKLTKVIWIFIMTCYQCTVHVVGYDGSHTTFFPGNCLIILSVDSRGLLHVLSGSPEVYFGKIYSILEYTVTPGGENPI